MRNLIVLIGLLSFRAIAGDTTYSRTESVPKRESGEESGGRSLLGEIWGDLDFSTPCETCPASRPSAAEKPPNMGAWPEEGWRWGWGLGLEGLGVPDQAGGFHAKIDGEATFEFSEATQMRLQGGGFAGALAPSVDYRRDVYVDGRLIGSQYDTTLLFTQTGFSFFSDFLRVYGKEANFLGAGIGMVSLRESGEFDRHEDFGTGDQALAEARWHWLPAVRAAWGFYFGRPQGPLFGRFELGYQATFNLPLYASSFPTDNSPITHTLSVGFACL